MKNRLEMMDNIPKVDTIKVSVESQTINVLGHKFYLNHATESLSVLVPGNDELLVLCLEEIEPFTKALNVAAHYLKERC